VRLDGAQGADIALTHHERFDGSGYPKHLSGDQIPLSGRIVAIADVYDALTSARPYKAAWPAERALDYIRDKRGTHFDPRLATAFLQLSKRVADIREELPDEPPAER